MSKIAVSRFDDQNDKNDVEKTKKWPGNRSSGPGGKSGFQKLTEIKTQTAEKVKVLQCTQTNSFCIAVAGKTQKCVESVKWTAFHDMELHQTHYQTTHGNGRPKAAVPS